MNWRSTSQKTTSSFTPIQTGLLQRKCKSCGQHRIAGGACTNCQPKSGLQRKLTIGASNDPLELEADRIADRVLATPANPTISTAPPRIQRSTGQTTEQADVAPASVDRVLSSPGRPLETSLQQDMGQRFGHDFSRVRVHTGDEAARSAQEVNASAYTTGHKIVFGAGQFAPETHEGRLLIAHELTHVVQQKRHATQWLQRSPLSQEDEDGREREADDMGGRLGRRLGRTSSGSTTSYREALETLPPPPRPTPPAAMLQDRTPRVLDRDRPQFEDLRTFLQTLPSQLRALVATGSPGKTSNSNIQSALNVLDSLVNDLNSERFVIRFDLPTGSTESASYDYINNIMHVHPFKGAAQRTYIAIYTLHEYAHILQDREAEAAFTQQATPHAHTLEESLQKEIGARREQIYFTDLVSQLQNGKKYKKLPTTTLWGQFEQERTASTARKRSEATREIRSTIEATYQSQLQKNSSIKTHTIEIDQRNHALLRWNLPGQTSPRDLGKIPPMGAGADISALDYSLEQIIRRLAEFNTLFDNPGGQRYQILTFFVIYGGRKVTEFGVVEQP
jgi:Domain of unknown function (DUF4157)